MTISLPTSFDKDVRSLHMLQDRAADCGTGDIPSYPCEPPATAWLKLMIAVDRTLTLVVELAPIPAGQSNEVLNRPGLPLRIPSLLSGRFGTPLDGGLAL